MRILSTIAIAVALTIPTGSATAQVVMTEAPDEWHVEVTPYLWVAGLQGILTIGTTASDMDASIGDVWGNLDFSLAGHVEVGKNRWTLIGEAFYMNLGADAELDDGSPAEADMQQVIGEVAAAYRMGRSWRSSEVIFGVRFTSLESEIRSGGTAVAERDIGWVDPFIGIRLHWDFIEKLPITLTGDVGGFEIGGADWTWKVTGGAGYHVSNRVALNAGYRALGVDYSQGTGNEQFIYDVTQHGLVVGITFAF